MRKATALLASALLMATPGLAEEAPRPDVSTLAPSKPVLEFPPNAINQIIGHRTKPGGRKDA